MVRARSSKVLVRFSRITSWKAKPLYGVANPFASPVPVLILIQWLTLDGIEFILCGYFNLAQADNVGDQFVGLFFFVCLFLV